MASGYHNPGYAVAQTVDEILQRRKAEARQAMLDELNARVQKSNMDEAAMRNKAYAQQMESEAALRKAQEADLFMKRLGAYAGTDYEPTEAERQRGKDLGLEGMFMPPQDTMTTGDVTGETPESGGDMPMDGSPSPTIKATMTHTGWRVQPTYAQQQDQLQEILLQKAIQDPNTPENLRHYYQTLQMIPGQKQTPGPAGLYESGETFEHDNATGAIKDLTHPGANHTPKKGDTIVQRSRPPQPPAAATPVPQFVVKIDRDTGAATAQPVTVEGSGKQLNTPDAGVNIVPQVPQLRSVDQQLEKNLRDAQAEARKAHLGMTGFTHGTPESLAKLKTVTEQYINAFPIPGPPEQVNAVKDIARRIFANPSAKNSSVDALLQATDGIVGTPLEGALRNLLAVILEKQ